MAVVLLNFCSRFLTWCLAGKWWQRVCVPILDCVFGVKWKAQGNYSKALHGAFTMVADLSK